MGRSKYVNGKWFLSSSIISLVAASVPFGAAGVMVGGSTLTTSLTSGTAVSCEIVACDKVADLSDEELLSQLRTLNPKVAADIDSIFAPQLLSIHEWFSKFSGSNRSVITDWCKNYRTLDSKIQLTKLTELLAVISRGAQLTHKYQPRSTQLLSVLAMLNEPEGDEGRLIQVATGEGKSLITAMTAAAKALLGHKVDVFSSSSVLCAKDHMEQRSFYQLLGLDCGLIDEEDDYATKEKLYTHYPIIYGTPNDFEWDYLNGLRKGRAFESTTVLIDEVDSLLIDQFEDLALLSTPLQGADYLMPVFAFMYAELQARIIDFSQSPDTFTQLKVIQAVVSKTQKVLNGEISDLTIHIPDRLKAFAQLQLPLWANSALQVYYEGADEDFVQEGANILPVDMTNTGVVHENQVYGNGRHQFLQLKHYATLTPETLLGRYISHVSYIRKYPKVFGMSGTLGEDDSQAFMHEVFRTQHMRIPTFRKKQFVEEPAKLLSTLKDWQEAVLGSIQEQTDKGRAVLVLCESIKTLKGFTRELDRLGKSYVAYQRSDKEDKIPDSIDPGTIILATNLGGRGTDIKLSSQVELNGGLHVCVTFLPRNQRVEAQNFGRTARQGKKGSAELILFEGDLIHPGWTSLNKIGTGKSKTSDLKLTHRPAGNYLYSVTDIAQLIRLSIGGGALDGGAVTLDGADVLENTFYRNGNRYVLPPISAAAGNDPFCALTEYLERFFANADVMAHKPSDILIPLNPGMHWVLLRIEVQAEGSVRVTYIDSLESRDLAERAETDAEIIERCAVIEPVLNRVYNHHPVTFQRQLGRLQPDNYACGVLTIEHLKDIWAGREIATQRLSSTDIIGLRRAHQTQLTDAGLALDSDEEANTALTIQRIEPDAPLSATDIPKTLGNDSTSDIVSNIGESHDVVHAIEPAITISSVRQRREQQVRKLLSGKLHIELPMQLLDDAFYSKIEQLIEKLRDGDAPNPKSYTLKDAKIDAIMELWAAQKSLFSTYKSYIEHQLMSELLKGVQSINLSLGQKLDTSPDYFIDWVANKVGMSSNALKDKVLSYLWVEKAKKDLSSFKVIVQKYMGDSLELLSLLSQLTDVTLVVIDQEGETEIFKGGDSAVLFIGKIDEGHKAPEILEMPKRWVLHDTVMDSNTFFHAIEHQIQIRGYAVPAGIGSIPKGQSLSEKLRRLTYGTSDNKKNNGAEDLKAFTKAISGVVAVAKEESLDEGYTYHYYKDGALVTKHKVEEIELSDLPIYYIIEGKVVRDGNIFEKKPDEIVTHYKSVITSPHEPLSPVSIVPNIFDTIPYYRGRKDVLCAPSRPTHLHSKYATLIVRDGGVNTAIQALIDKAPVLPKLESVDLTFIQGHADYSSVEKAYELAMSNYYQHIADQEKAFLQPILESFITECERRFHEDTLVLSPPILNKLVTHQVSGLDGYFANTIASEPLLRYLTYYLQGRYLVQAQKAGYKEETQRVLTNALDALPEGMMPWHLSFMLVGMNEIDGSDKKSEEMAKMQATFLARQINGRLGFFSSLRQNIYSNLEFIKENIKENTKGIDHEVSKEADFKKMGVIESDEGALRSNGIAAFIDLIEIPPEPSFGDIFGMTILGLVQAAGGALCIWTGLGADFGATLLSEGLQDLYTAVKSGITREAIDWASYWVNKGISALMTVASAAYGAIKDGAKSWKEGFSSFKNKLLGKTSEVTAHGVTMSAKRVLVKTAVTTLGDALTNEAANCIRRDIVKGLKEDIKVASKKSIETLTEDKEFMRQFKVLKAFNYAVQGAEVFSPFKGIGEEIRTWSQTDTIASTISLTR